MLKSETELVGVPTSNKCLWLAVLRLFVTTTKEHQPMLNMVCAHLKKLRAELASEVTSSAEARRLR